MSKKFDCGVRLSKKRRASHVLKCHASIGNSVFQTSEGYEKPGLWVLEDYAQQYLWWWKSTVGSASTISWTKIKLKNMNHETLSFVFTSLRKQMQRTQIALTRKESRFRHFIKSYSNPIAVKQWIVFLLKILRTIWGYQVFIQTVSTTADIRDQLVSFFIFVYLQTFVR